MTARSDKPFAEAMRELMAERDVSFRKLAYLTGQHRHSDHYGGGYNLGYLNRLSSGRFPATPENAEVIARALGVEPEYFAVYREQRAAEEARRLAREVGLDEVMEALARLDGGRG